MVGTHCAMCWLPEALQAQTCLHEGGHHLFCRLDEKASCSCPYTTICDLKAEKHLMTLPKKASSSLCILSQQKRAQKVWALLHI